MININLQRNYLMTDVTIHEDTVIIVYKKISDPKPEEKQRPIKRDHRKKKRPEKVRDRYGRYKSLKDKNKVKIEKNHKRLKARIEALKQ